MDADEAGVRAGMRAYLLGGRPILFPFLSGILRYDCATCDAPCCKGASLGIGRSIELVNIQHAQPKATLFAVPQFRGSKMLALATPAEKCWFLDRKNRCRLEKVLGREAKPAGFRLFPFVRIRAAGERASATTPLAWLRMEPVDDRADLELTIWPGGEERRLARVGYHGSPVQLLAEEQVGT